MRSFSRMAMVAGLVMAIGMHASPAAFTEDPLGLEVDPRVNRKKGKGKNNRRGKGKVDRPTRKPNRLTISKRVRRKHRRAA